MKFARTLSSSRFSALSRSTPASFVATDSKRVVFEVAVTGGVEADVTVTEDLGDTHIIKTVLKVHEEQGLVTHPSKQRSTSKSGGASKLARLDLRELLLGRGSTLQNVLLWVLYGIWIIISSFH